MNIFFFFFGGERFLFSSLFYSLVFNDKQIVVRIFKDL